MAADEYGNKINRPNRSTKGGRRGSSEKLQRLAGKSGAYVPIFTGQRRGVTQQKLQSYPLKPDTWKGSEPEWAIYWAHSVLGLKENQDFAYLFYYGDAGTVDSYESAQFDFYEFDVNVAIEIQGIYWHYEFGGKKKVAQDQERKIRAEAVGLTLIFIDEDDAIADPVYFLRQARAGVDRSRVSRGF